VAQGMAFKVNVGSLHFVNLVPVQILWVGIDIVGDKKDRRFHTVFFQYREGTCIVVLITIVEGDKNRFFGKFFTGIE